MAKRTAWGQPMVSVTVFVEGGSRGDLATSCRKGFRRFFENVGLKGHMPSVVSCGSRKDAYDRFCVALSDSREGEIPLLLVDSEELVPAHSAPWPHLRSRDCWDRPEGAQREQAHLMVQCMESWFFADISALQRFFGTGFKSPPKRDDIENIPKQDVLNGLATASRNSRKGQYHKGRHSFDILAQIDPEKVIECSPYAKQLVETLKKLLTPA